MSDNDLKRDPKVCLQIINENAMTVLGAKLAKLTFAGMIVYLEGDLGAGKTTLVRGVLRTFGHQGAVKSPTFTIVEPYSLDYNKFYDYNELEANLKLNLYHFDLYRLEDPEELEYLGIRDYLDGQAVAFIEWPEKGRGILPSADIIIKITYQNQIREVELIPQSVNGSVVISKLTKNWNQETDV